MWFQSPEYLRWSRKQMLTVDNMHTIVKKAKLDGSKRILEIGCGSGEMTHLLASELGCVITAIDNDSSLIHFAKTAYPVHANFIVADALNLPFEDSTFDVVISHTFFTSIFDAEKAMSEMQRVCEKNGTIISITAETFLYIPNSISMPNTPWYEEYKLLKEKVDTLFISEAKKVSNGVKPELIPEFFADCGLEGISVYQLGKFFSLSNAAMTELERNELISDEYDAEIVRAALLNDLERAHYIELLRERMSNLMDYGEHTWSWSGGSNLLVIATNAKKGIISASDYLELKAVEAANKDILTHESAIRANCKSVASVSLSSVSTNVVAVGETPLQATLQAHKKLLAEKTISTQVSMLELNQLTKLLDDENSLLSIVLEIIGINSVKEKKSILSDLFKTSKKIPCLKYKRASDETYHFLPISITDWCFSSESTVCERNQTEAIKNCLFIIIAQYVLSMFMHGEMSLHEISAADIIGCRTECIIQKIRNYGYNIKCWEAMFANAIPVVFACVSNEKGSIVNVSADYSRESALDSCILSLFENRQLENLVKGRKKYVQEPYKDEDFYNFIKTGENVFPCGFLEKAEPKEAHENVGNDNVSLLHLLKSQNLDIYLSEHSVGDYVAVKMIVPSKYTIWPFAKKRLIEYQLQQQVKPIVSNLDLFENDQVEYVMEYISRKSGWQGENTYAFFAGTGKDAFLFGEKVDARILLATYYIKKKQYVTATTLLPSSNSQFRCLKCALEYSDKRILTDNYTKVEIEKAFDFLNNPYKALRENIDFHEE